MPQPITTNGMGAPQPIWITILRVVLGIILIWKGINFIRDTATLQSTIEQTGIGVFSQSSGVIATVVSILSLLCGFFITVGLFTRISSVVQIPILLSWPLFL